MEFVHEISARLENKPGRLAKICAALAHEKINIRALSVMDTNERSVLRLVVDQLEPARTVLTSLGVEAEHAEVLAVEMENRPGGLTKILERLAAEHINIEYAYASGASAPGKSLGIFHTSNPKRALQVLHEAPSNGVTSRGRPAPPAHALRRPEGGRADPERRPRRARDRRQRRGDRPHLRGGRRAALAGASARVPPGRPPPPPGRPRLLGEPLRPCGSSTPSRRSSTPSGRLTSGSFPRRAAGAHYDVDFRPGDALVFGPESRGLPARLLAEHAESVLRIPMLPEARSLNLANAVAVGLYEAVRRVGLDGNGPP